MNIMTAVRARPETLPDYLKNRNALVALKRNSCIEIPVNPDFLKRRVRTIIKGMRTITESAEDSANFPFHSHIIDAYGEKYHQEAGLKHETKDGENKYVFQFIRGARYAHGIMGARTDGVYGPFLHAFASIENFARSIALDIATYMDNAYGHKRPYEGSLRDRINHGTVVVRGIRYLAVDEGRPDAIPHIDRGLISIHIYATHEGLCIVLPNGEKIRIRECEFDTVCAFFGRKYMAATKNATVGAPHGVKYKRVGVEDRYCIVAFVHPLVLPGDVAWLLANDAAVKAYEQRILL